MSSSPQPTLGVHLLESITLGMYSDPLHCIREYIQNAYDSIREARRQGLLNENEGKIELVVDPEAALLKVRDDGAGMSPEEAIVRLVDIGASEKAVTHMDAAKHAGFRGIGRLAGISYCRRLSFETSNGGAKSCRVEFNAAGINELAKPGQQPQTIVDAINKNCSAEELRASGKSRFFEVTLEGVTNDALLDLNGLEQYLELTAPVRHDPSKWSFQEKVKDLAAESGFADSLDSVRLFVCGPNGNVLREIFRPFKNTFESRTGRSKSKRRVKVAEVVALPRTGEYAGWWGWLAVHERRGALADVSFAGLRLRMHNIAIGDHSIIQELWTSASQALWCFGEIHVVNPELVPNTQRDNFEASKAWDKLKEELRAEVVKLEKEIRKESEERNRSTETLTRRAENVVRETKGILDAGLKSHNEKQALLAKLQRQRDSLDKGLRKRTLTPEETAQLKEHLTKVERFYRDVEAVKRTKADDDMSYLGKQARKAVRTVLGVVKTELNDDKRFAVIEERVHAALRQGNKDR